MSAGVVVGLICLSKLYRSFCGIARWWRRSMPSKEFRHRPKSRAKESTQRNIDVEIWDLEIDFVAEILLRALRWSGNAGRIDIPCTISPWSFQGNHASQLRETNSRCPPWAWLRARLFSQDSIHYLPMGFQVPPHLPLSYVLFHRAHLSRFADADIYTARRLLLRPISRPLLNRLQFHPQLDLRDLPRDCLSGSNSVWLISAHGLSYLECRLSWIRFQQFHPLKRKSTLLERGVGK